VAANRDWPPSSSALDKVEGTAVYNRQSERLGTMHNFVVDKPTGQVASAVFDMAACLYHLKPADLLQRQYGLY